MAAAPLAPLHPNQTETAMNGLEDPGLQEQIELDSRLTDLGRIEPWIDAVASRFGVSEQTRFALHLCMEEILANVVLHGYRSEPGHPIRVAASSQDGSLLLSVEDTAPPFELTERIPPLDGRPVDDLESLQPGGNGIRLVRHFASSIDYERTPGGNRLTLGFAIAPR